MKTSFSLQDSDNFQVRQSKAKEYEFECDACGCYVAKEAKCKQCENLGVAYDEMEAHRCSRGY